MGDFPFADRTNLRSFKRRDGSGFAVQRGKLDFVGQAILVNVNHRAHVARFQTFRRHGRCQYNRSCSEIIISFRARIRANQSRNVRATVNYPNSSHHGRLSARRIHSTLDNILATMESFHPFRDLRGCCKFSKCQRQPLPLVLIETKREEKGGFPAIIGVSRIENIMRNLFAFDGSAFPIGQLHWSQSKAASRSVAILSSIGLSVAGEWVKIESVRQTQGQL